MKCSADKLAVVTLASILQLSASEIKDVDQEVILKFSTVLESIGKNVEKQILEDKTDALFEEYVNKRKNEKKPPITDANLIRRMLVGQVKEVKKNLRSCNEGVYELAGLVLKALMESAQIKDKFDKQQPAFHHEIINDPNSKTKKQGILRISKEFLSILMGKAQNKKKEVNYLYLERTLPMIYPPARWVDWETGGYLQKGFAIMRLQGSRLQRTSLERADLSKICKVLDIMGDTSWRINSKVLDVVEELYNLGGGVGEIPFVDKGNKFLPSQNMNYFQKQKLQKEKKDNWSMLSDFEIKLGIARKFKHVERFYMPLNVDFRGRIYPISPHLNQIGNDTSRGLLEFAEGKPLGKSGLLWLKIHLANKMGFDKLKIAERISIVEKLMPDIKDMARDPIKYRKWLDFEDSWQSLATIFDLVEAMNSKNPEEYISRLHIHQDGSCNGLQHYAALGRDIEGAEQVNLVDREKPGDLYTAVSEKVQQIVDEDAKAGKKLAEKLQGQIKRKIVKQTVMTSVYGVTFIGAKDQILRQLRERTSLPEEDLVPASVYLAKITMKVLEHFFEGAQRIKEWLIDSAGMIAKKGYPVSWITPLGLPVVQPYRRGQTTMFIDTFFQRVSLISNKDSLPISVPKQKSAFPPNFVHSLDSTHLMLTAVECHKVGIEFAAVHDSFWTHACNIDNMNVILREQFVHLHSQPLLDNLLEGFKSQYPTIKFKDIPQRGKFDLKGVINSKYFFA